MESKFESMPNTPMLKGFFDAALTTTALLCAFVAKVITDLLTKSSDTARSTFEHLFSGTTFLYIAIAITSTLLSFFMMGLYNKKKTRNNWRPLLVISASMLPALLMTQFLFFTSTNFNLPRGAVVYYAFFNLLLLAGPRLVKQYLTRKITIEILRSKRKKTENVLIIGGAGYVGSYLSEELLNQGYKVRIIDSLMFGEKPVEKIKDHENLDLVVGDFRNIETLSKCMKNIDAVVHLAGIVGDPACSIDDDFTIDVNLSATSMVAEVCKTFGVERLIFASTCSVYGQSTSDKPLSETSELNPVSLYARTKIASEEVLMNLKSDNFSPTVLRFATLFGLSPRPRFDLAVNILSARAATVGSFNVFGGNQWRPFVHVKDTSKAIIATLKAPVEKVKGQVYNIGSNENNYKIIDIGNKILELYPEANMVVDEGKEDNRNYFVNFDKLNNDLDVHLERKLEEGIKEIYEAFKNKEISDFSSPNYSNLIQTEKIVLEVNSPSDPISHHKKTAKSLLRKIDN